MQDLSTAKDAQMNGLERYLGVIEGKEVGNSGGTLPEKITLEVFSHDLFSGRTPKENIETWLQFLHAVNEESQVKRCRPGQPGPRRR